MGCGALRRGFLLIWGIEYVGNRIAAKKGEA